MTVSCYSSVFLLALHGLGTGTALPTTWKDHCHGNFSGCLYIAILIGGCVFLGFLVGVLLISAAIKSVVLLSSCKQDARPDEHAYHEVDESLVVDLPVTGANTNYIQVFDPYSMRRYLNMDVSYAETAA